MAGDRHHDRDRGDDRQFATIKDGTKLVLFGDDRGSKAIRGLNPGETVGGIDVRPTDGDGATSGQDEGKLYGVGRAGTAGRASRSTRGRARSRTPLR